MLKKYARGHMRDCPKLGSLNAMEERQEAQASQDQGSGQDLLAATYRMTRMEFSLATGANVSK